MSEQRKRGPMPSYVTVIHSWVIVQVQSNRTGAALRELGFQPLGRGRLRGLMGIQTPTRAETVKVLKALIALGVAFSEGRDWSPIAVARHCREQGWLTGRLKRIYWAGPNDWHVEEV